MKDKTFYTGKPKRKTWLGKLIVAFLGLATAVGITVGLVHTNDTPPAMPDAPIDGRSFVGVSGSVAFTIDPLSDTSLCDSLAGLGINVFKWIGPQMGDYDWTTGKLDTGGGYVATLEQLAVFTKRTGCYVIIGLNMFKSCDFNIACILHADSLGIKLIGCEAGNEINNVDNPGRLKYPNVSVYCDTLRSWIPKLKTSFPDLKICGVGENKRYPGGEHWNDSVLAAGADVVSTHIGVDPIDYISNDILDTARLDSILNIDWIKTGMAALPVDKKWATETNWKYSPKEIISIISSENKYKSTLYILNWLSAKKLPVVCVRASTGDKQGAFVVTKGLKHTYTIVRGETGQAIYDFLHK